MVILVVFLLGRSTTFAPKIRKLVRVTVSCVMVLNLRAKLFTTSTRNCMSHSVLSMVMVMINPITRLIHVLRMPVNIPFNRPPPFNWVVLCRSTVNRSDL